MASTLTESDEGKAVVNASGEQVGIVSGFRGGVAYVDPDPGIGDRLMSKLGWGDVDDGDYPLDGSDVETVTDDEVRLRRF